MELVKLAKKLISIPSYVDSLVDERQIGEFIFDYLKKFPYLKVKKQFIDARRFNIVATTPGTPRLLLAAHMDTVEPKQGWTKNQFGKDVVGDKLFGAGTVDTKGGMAAMIDALTRVNGAAGLTMLFYCDEEYDFQGMRKFLETPYKARPQLAVLAEQTDLKILNAHRGLMEVSFSVTGKTGHAADPNGGVNAIRGMNILLSKLEIWLKQLKDPVLGQPSLNVAYIYGGLNLSNNSSNIDELIIGKQGNNIADYAQVVIDIRTTSMSLRAQDVRQWIQQTANKEKLKLIEFNIRHDLGSLSTSRSKLSRVEKALQAVTGKVAYLSPRDQGYGDGQLLQEQWGIPVAYVGPVGGNAHGANEWVSIASLKKLSSIYETLIKYYSK